MDVLVPQVQRQEVRREVVVPQIRETQWPVVSSRPSPLGRARRGAAKTSVDSAEALRHWTGLALEERQHLLHFNNRQLIDCAFAIQEGLRKFEQDCMQKGIVFKNTEGLTVLSVGLNSFGFLPQASGHPGQPVPEAFVARGPLLSSTDDEFAKYMDSRLGGFLTGCRPPLRRELWAGIFEPTPHSWVEFECQALRLVEQAILHSYLEAASIATAAEAAVANAANEPPEDDWLALAEELSERVPTPGKKARRKAAKRRVRMAAVVSGGECEDNAAIEVETIQEPAIEGCVAEDASSSKEPCLSGSSVVDEADTSGEARGEQESPSPSPRKKERKQVSESLSFGGHSRVDSQSTACGSICEVKSNYSECGSDAGSDMGVLCMVEESFHDVEAVGKVILEPLSATMSAEWVSNGGRGNAAEWHLWSPQHLGNSFLFRAVVKNTFLELEVATPWEEPARIRARSVDARS